MSTHHGFIKEFPFIRIDAFDGSASYKNPYTGLAPCFHLLTHAHTDHITGLNSPDFGGQIYCTLATKNILFHTMEVGNRVKKVEFPDSINAKHYKFHHLKSVSHAHAHHHSNGHAKGKARLGMGIGMRCITELNYDEPTTIENSETGQKVIITAIDANHCPGSAMFLIEDPLTEIAVLVTGDIRVETDWLTKLSQHPQLSPYLSSTRSKKLNKIYLDTSCMEIDRLLTQRKEAIQDLINLIKYYPKTYKFFLNAWTWGYEELIKGISDAFEEPIHVDWYKRDVYKSLRSTDAKLSLITGSNATYSSNPRLGFRFHACERYWKCDDVWVDGRGCFEWHPDYELSNEPSSKNPKKLKRPGIDLGDRKVVYVNPAEAVEHRTWKAFVKATENVLKECQRKQDEGENDVEWPCNLFVSLSRHSTLPELRDFVRLFRPLSLYPLTISDPPQDPGLTFRILSKSFSTDLDRLTKPSQLVQEGFEELFLIQRARSGGERDYRLDMLRLARQLEIERERGGGSDDDGRREEGGCFLNLEKLNGVRENVEGGEEALKIVQELARGIIPFEKKNRNVDSDKEVELTNSKFVDEEESEVIVFDDSDSQSSTDRPVILVPPTSIEQPTPSCSKSGDPSSSIVTSSSTFSSTSTLTISTPKRPLATSNSIIESNEKHKIEEEDDKHVDIVKKRSKFETETQLSAEEKERRKVIRAKKAFVKIFKSIRGPRSEAKEK